MSDTTTTPNPITSTVLKLPMLQEQFSKEFTRNALGSAKKIKTNYGNILKAVSATIGVPVDVIVGFMIIENDEANPTATSYTCTAAKKATGDCYVGLMQMGAPTAFDTMRIQSKDLAPAEASVIQKYLPGFLKVNGVGSLSDWKMKIYQALQIPEFAIWIGTLHLAQLMKATTDSTGQYRLDHVIIKYNRGVGNFIKEVVRTSLKDADTATLAAKLPVAETRAYIKKFVGKGGSVECSGRVPMP
jgi:hypothetical protein